MDSIWKTKCHSLTVIWWAKVVPYKVFLGLSCQLYTGNDILLHNRGPRWVDREQTGQTGLGTSTIYVEYPFKCHNPRDGDVDKVYTDSRSTGQVTDTT